MRILCCFIFLTFINFIYHCSATGHDHHHKFVSATVLGAVYCDSCFNRKGLEHTNTQLHSLAGASVAVECGRKGPKPRIRLETKTNEVGEFTVQLPFAVREHVKRIKRCRVKLEKSNEPRCSVPSTAISSSLNLQSREQGLYTFSSGVFTFKPSSNLKHCYNRGTHSLSRLLLSHDQKTVADHPNFFFNPPSIPFLPAPPPFGLPPNPFQPPPSILPPLPFIPPPPPFINLPPIPFLTPSPPPPFFSLPPLPPFPHLPPLSPLPQLPPIPFFTPPPPPSPPPPIFRFPPIHFPPLPPIFPGIPPAASPSPKTSP